MLVAACSAYVREPICGAKRRTMGAHAVTALVVSLGADQPISAAQELTYGLTLFHRPRLFTSSLSLAADGSTRLWAAAGTPLAGPSGWEPVRSRIQRLLSEPSFQARLQHPAALQTPKCMTCAALPQENADRIARRMWRPYPARATAADVIERVLHTGAP